ncbi:MAG: sulfatase, partial [Planctomycetota bacterium]
MWLGFGAETIWAEAGVGAPNVLVIVSDDLNARLGSYGWSRMSTPSLDALAADALRFERAYCQYPVCNPSRTSFLTGLRPEDSGVVSNTVYFRDLYPELVTLPEFFRSKGYWVGGVGKVHHKAEHDATVAWDEYHRFDNAWNPVERRYRLAFEAEHGSIESARNERAWARLRKEIRKEMGAQTPPGYGPTTMTDAQHKDGQNARQVVKWLRQKPYGDKPFLMMCGLQKPHVPFWAPQKYFDLYPVDEVRFLRDPADDWDDIPPVALSQRYKQFGVPAGDDAKRREVTAAYQACVSFIDAQVGLMIDELKAQGLYDNTVIVFTSDHGYHLGEHGMWGKVTLFEECARVPMIVRAPGRTGAGTVTHGLVELVDLYPTLSDLCGFEAPGHVTGLSFAPLLSDPGRKWKRGAFTVVSRGQGLGRSVRTERFRYAEWVGDPELNELYDLVSDPR